MFVDSGCRRTLIPKAMYNRKMGEIKPTHVRFRPYGTNKTLKCYGEINSTIKTNSGATQKTTAYIVEGHQAEPLLGKEDAVNLGILVINKDGKELEEPEQVQLVANDIRAQGITITDELVEEEEVDPDAKKRIW